MAHISVVQDRACRRLTVPQVAQAIASLGDHGGARYTDIRKALKENFGEHPNFFQLKSVLNKACKEGAVRQNSQGRWMLQIENCRPWGRVPATRSSSTLHRRRRRRGKGRGKKGKGKGKKKGKRRRRRSKGRCKGKKGKKGKGRRRRRRRGGKRKGKKR